MFELQASRDRRGHRVPIGAAPSASRRVQRDGQGDAEPQSRRSVESGATPGDWPPKSVQSYFPAPPQGFAAESASRAGAPEHETVVRKRQREEQTGQNTVAAEPASQPCDLQCEEKIHEGHAEAPIVAWHQ